MRKLLGAVAVTSALFATNAMAQVNGVDLNGAWRCVLNCAGHGGGFITQNGWTFNVVGRSWSSNGWVNYPGRIWLAQVNRAAVYSPDGLRIQFDDGTVWARIL